MQNRIMGGVALRRAPGLIVAGLLFPLPWGCAPSRPQPRVEAVAAEAVGLGVPLAFRTEGGPVDEGAEGASLSLSRAVERAVMSSAELQAALARVRIAAADSDQARLLPNPVLGVVLRWGAGGSQVEASLAQDFIRALQIPRRSSAADHRLRRAAADAVTVALDVCLEAQERYTNVQALDAIVPLLRERQSLAARLADAARVRLVGGEATRGEVAALEAQRVELEVELGATELQRQEERIRLARVIGEPSSPGEWELDSWVPPGALSEPVAGWIEAALVHCPEVQSIAWKLAALGDDEALARGLTWDGAGAGVEAQREDEWFIGPSVTSPVPVFDTGQARRARAFAERVEARHELTQVKRRVVEEVRVAYRAYAAGRAQLDRIQGELIPLQERRRRDGEEVYRVERDVTALLLSEQDLRAARVQAIDAERRVALARFRLQRTVGGVGAERSIHEHGVDPASGPAEIPALSLGEHGDRNRAPDTHTRGSSR